MSTVSEQRSAPTGRTAQTVAQQTRRPRRVGARGSHEGPEDQSGPSPQSVQTTRLRVHATAKRPWTVARLWTHRARPQPLGNLAQNARFPHRPPPSSCSDHQTGSERPDERSPDFYVLTWLPTDSCRHIIECLLDGFELVLQRVEIEAQNVPTIVDTRGLRLHSSEQAEILVGNHVRT